MKIAPFEVQVEALDEGIAAVTITGELDQATAEQLRGPLNEMVAGDTPAVMVDMSDCGFIDSTGLGVIVDGWKRFNQRDGAGPTFSICCPEPEVKRLLELTGLDQAIPTRGEREEAIALLQGAPG